MRHLVLLLAVLSLSGCVQLKWFGASGNTCEWDELDYKGYYNATGSASSITTKSDVPQFGACSDEDLANSTCK